MIQSVSTQTLHELMSHQDEVIILDVRASSAYTEWHIEHEHVKSINVQTSKLKADGPQAYPEIPTDKEIITVCAKGSASREAAEILEQNGYRVKNLDGGMQAWSEFYYTTPVVKTANLELLQVIRPAKGCLSYFLISGDEAVVVDPARHYEYYLELAQEKSVRIVDVYDTHCHADHISGGPVLAEMGAANYWVAASEMQDANIRYEALVDGQKNKFGSATLEVVAIPTPGHTPGSTSFMVNDKYLLSGDTVFVNGLGRPDLGGKAKEWAGMLYRTVAEKLSKIPDDVMILPAHYSDYTEINQSGYVGALFGDIRKDNDLLQNIDEATFTDAVAGNTGLTPPNYGQIVNINRGLVSPSASEASELEIGPNRCAVKHLA